MVAVFSCDLISVLIDEMSIGNRRILVLGIGRYTPVVAEHAEECGMEVVGFCHYDRTKLGQFIYRWKVTASTRDLLTHSLSDQNFVLSMGDGKVRLENAAKITELGGKLPILVHPASGISKLANIDVGVMVKRNATVQLGASLGRCVIVCDNSVICHDATIGSGCLVAANVVVGAGVVVGNRVMIGQGAVIPSGKVAFIGDDAIVGAGAVVVHDVPSRAVVAGNPARILRYRS